MLLALGELLLFLLSLVLWVGDEIHELLAMVIRKERPLFLTLLDSGYIEDGLGSQELLGLIYRALYIGAIGQSLVSLELRCLPLSLSVIGLF